MSLRLHALHDLVARYGSALRRAWQHRAALAPPERLPHELQFLPAALALQDTPVPPAPHIAIRALLAFAGLALLWSVFGRLEIVAVAPGRVVLSDGSKTIQAIETARIRSIRVADGQSVRVGDTLVELDDVGPSSDQDRLRGELGAAQLQAARGQALLDSLDSGIDRPLARPAAADDARVAEARRLLAGQLAEHRARLARLEADIDEREAAARATAETLRKLEQTVPLARQRASDLKDLADRNFISRHGYLESEQARIEQEADLAAQASRLEQTRAGLEQSRRQRSQAIAEARRGALDAIATAQQKAAAIEQDLRKAEARRAALRLVAPVSGTVQQLAVQTVGGVVTPAQPLLRVVPDDTPLEVEVLVDNADIGFVRTGQPVIVKVQTYPFTRYGTLQGRLASVSRDAISDDKRGLVYSARVRLAKTTLEVEGVTFGLVAGMAVSAEVKIGTRRVIDYVLSPAMGHLDEALRER